MVDHSTFFKKLRLEKKTSNVAVIVAISVVAAAAVAFGVWKVTRKKCKALTGMTGDYNAARIQNICINRGSEEDCKAAKVKGTGNAEPVRACQWVRA